VRLPSRAARLAGAAAAVVVIAVVAIAALGGGSTQPPATGAATVVPADALAYFHLSLDRGRPAVRAARALATAFPAYGALSETIESRLAAILGLDSPQALAIATRPWLGREAALAFLASAKGRAGSLIVLAAGNPAAASRFLTQPPAIADGSYRGRKVVRYPGGARAALAGGYVVIGQAASIRHALSAQAGAEPSLASSPTYQRAASGEPAGRVLDGYAPANGISRLLATSHGWLGALYALVAQPSLAAMSLSLSPATSGASVQLDSTFVPGLAAVGPNRAAPFTPTLAADVPRGATLMLDVSSLRQVAPRLLSAAASAGIGAGIAPLLARLGAALASEGVDVGSVLDLFSGETAVAVTSQQRRPALLILTHDAHPAQSRVQLATLELPLAQLFPASGSGPGQVSEFTSMNVDGVTVHRLELAPGLELDYAVFNGLLAVSTGLGAIEAVVRRAGALAQEAAYRAVLPGSSNQVTSLLFLDFSQLLRLGEQIGLVRGAGAALLRPDLQRIRAVGFSSRSGKTESTAEILFDFS
jgi:uncharacterized protein DUF3352